MSKAQICARGDRKEPGAEKAGAGTGMVLPWLLPLKAGLALPPPHLNCGPVAWSVLSPSWLHHHQQQQQQQSRGRECGWCQHQQQKAGMSIGAPIAAWIWKHEGDSELDGQEKFPPNPAAVFRQAPGLDAAHRKAIYS